MRLSSRTQTLIGGAVSVVCLYAALRGVTWSALAASLSAGHYQWLVPAGAVIVLGQVARGWRWQVLFGRHKRPSFVDALTILSVGYLVSAVLPLRLGDPVRAWLVRGRSGVGGYEALATVMAERALDLLTLLALLALWVPRLASKLLTDRLGPGVWSQSTTLTAVGLVVLAIVYLGLVAFGRAGPRAIDGLVHASRRLGLAPRLISQIGSAAGRFAIGFQPLGDIPTAIMAIGASIAIWLIGAWSYWLVMQAFDLPFDFAAALFSMCGTGLMAVLPSSPGYAGVFHLGVRISLALVDPSIGPDRVQAFALVLHAFTILVLIVLGAVAMLRLGLSRMDLVKGLDAATEAEQAGPD